MGRERAWEEEGLDGAAPGGHASQGPFLNPCRRGEHRPLIHGGEYFAARELIIHSGLIFSIIFFVYLTSIIYLCLLK